jgi:copper chaperone NosL
MSTPLVAIVALALLSSACGARAMGPPEIVVDRTACSHCGMYVSEPVYAAAYQVGDNDPRVFDDIGCLLEAIDGETASPITIWLQDAAGAGWIDAQAAVVVASPRLRTPMNGGLLAYGNAAAAEQAASTHGGHVMRSWQEVETWKRGAR